MKLQALLIAIAVAAGGSAFAATDTAKADAKDTASKQTTTTKKTTKKVKKTKRMHASNRDAARQMMGGSAAPDTDLTASDRQSRIDEAYSKWRSTNPQ